MVKNKLFLIWSVVFLLSVLLSACSGGNSEAVNSEKTSEQALRLNIKQEPYSLNPQLSNDTTSMNVLQQMFEGLTRVGKDGKPENGMAEHIQVSDDLRTYTFTLRDAKWSNGDPVTAHDFEYAWKWALNPENESKQAWYLYYIKNAKAAHVGEASLDEVGVKAIDNKTLEVTLEAPAPYFLELTAFSVYFPVNSNIAKEQKGWYLDAGENFVTNGPFTLTNWEHNNEITLEKNEQYWDVNAVNLEKIQMLMINDQNTELNMFENNELDWAGSPTGSLPAEAIPTLQDKGTLNIQSIAATYWYVVNVEQKPLNNKKVRQALALAINREGIVKNITKGGQLPAMSMVPPAMIPENEQGYFKDNDIENAKKLLAEGLKEEGIESIDQAPPITVSYNTDEGHAKIAQAIQDMWKKNLGLEVTLENTEWKVYLDQLSSGDFMVGRLGWSGDFNDLINFLEIYKEEGGNNYPRWINKDYQALLTQSSEEKDPEKRFELMKKAEAIIMDEMPIIPIYYYTNVWVQNPKLKDVVISGLGHPQYKWAYFE